MRELRPYQEQGLEALRQTLRQGIKRPVLMLPTGGGKTLIAATIANGVLAKKNRMAFVVPRISLITQTVEEFWKEDVRDVGVIQADHPLTDWAKPIQVCSIDSIRSKAVFPDAKVVIFDEAHILTETHKKWMAEHPETIFIALSATPWAKGMAKHFETLLVVSTMKELMDLGWLSGYRAFGVGNPDLRGVRKVGDDYNQGQLSERMNSKELVGNAVETWKERHGKDRTMCFAVDRAHAKALQERFEQSGIPCGYQDAYTKDDERAEIKKKFHDGTYPVVASVGTLTLGTDWDCRCISDCQPTQSEMRFVQKFGRGVRLAAPGSDPKEYLVYLDHAGNIGGRDTSLGYPERIMHDQLDDGAPKEKKEISEPLPKPCSQCAYMKPPRVAVCPNCGFKAVAVSGVGERDGELIELIPGGMPRQKKGAKREYTMAEKAAFFGELKTYAKGHNYKDGWCANKYREKFEAWPNHPSIKLAPAKPVTMETSMWLRHTQIKWARDQAKNQERGQLPLPPRIEAAE